MPTSAEWRRELETERTMKNGFMARDPDSPFVVGRVPFHDLTYFPPDPRYVVRATLDRCPAPEEAYLRTNRDNQAVMRYLGNLTFSFGGAPLKLRLYHAGEAVGPSAFVPFRDRTSGQESYGPGRYLTLELNDTDEYELDFNRAFNPYCAYTDDFECAFPPPENDLPVRIPAGEKAWAEEQNPRSPSSALLRRARRPTNGAPSRAAKGGRTRQRSR